MVVGGGLPGVEKGEEAFLAGGITKYPVDRFRSTGIFCKEWASEDVRGR